MSTITSSDSFNKTKKKNNWRQKMRKKVSTLVHTKRSDEMVGVNSLDYETGDFTESQQRTSAEEKAKEKTYQDIRESDSIQRAMTDLHRRSKLLNNFAIMNSTGFIKIIKKFDKKIPLWKGIFSEVLTDGYVCKDGKEVQELSERMVSNFNHVILSYYLVLKKYKYPTSHFTFLSIGEIVCQVVL